MIRDGLKVLNGRVATKDDADAGRVVFYIPDARSVPYRFEHDLPLLAKVTTPDERVGFPPSGSLVTIVQAEQGDNGEILLGLMYGECEEGLCQLGEVEVIGRLDEAPTFQEL